MTERWIPVEKFEDCYEVSNLGNIRSLDRTVRLGSRTREIVGGELVPEQHTDGYLRVDLRRNTARLRTRVHRLVATHFIPNPDGKPIVNHKDRDRKNNAVTNLEWCTESENQKHWRDDEKAQVAARLDANLEEYQFDPKDLPW